MCEGVFRARRADSVRRMGRRWLSCIRGTTRTSAACPAQLQGAVTDLESLTRVDSVLLKKDPQRLGDREIRTALRAQLEARWAGRSDTRFIEELALCRGRTRIDLAVVNGVLHGYEIKSDRDRLDRLPSQVELYGRVVDRATIVVGSSHLCAAIRIVPTWWGVMRVEADPDGDLLHTVRVPGENPKQDPRALVELLWRDDALALLETRQAARGVRSKPRPAIWDRVCEHFELGEIAAAVRGRLRCRAECSAPLQPV